MSKEKFYYIETKMKDGKPAIMKFKTGKKKHTDEWRIKTWWRAYRMVLSLRKQKNTAFKYRLCSRTERKGTFK